MAGTVNISLQQQFDSQGLPLGGGLLYCFQSGTSTPATAFKDIALTLAHQNPVPLDASGRVPQMFFADGTIKLRLTSRDGGTVVFEADFMPVLGASSGGAVGGSVDATTVFATGDLKHRYQDGVISGWVRANGNTIGSATSGATERANADCQSLFQYLWTNDTSLTVSTGRGASAAADWAANKTITLPDMRGRTLAGMDTMGSTAAQRIHVILAGNILGQSGGNQLYTISVGNLPAHTPSGNIVFNTTGNNLYTPGGSIVFSSTGSNLYTPAGSVSTNVTVNAAATGITAATLNSYIVDGGTNQVGTGGSTVHIGNTVQTNVTVTDPTHPHTASASSAFAGTQISATFSGTQINAAFAGNSIGSGTQMSIAQPTMVVTIYIKL